ncbi:hypothetical protein BGP77_06905 [Saccharospirillum sp. MSK14-1]|uniref:hypothetical protein n=1 Tax=Saccharospirillum sp. MSK14-1 TaxID=1897632 RepID=UPI000D348BE2|nr:hypothetical protein [Saccharospirillum sp. MSK14-1]PTY37006.1 hypothetical protein BGP77_06905 [Saccharospirillum sp. MSK14-1]
MTDLIETQRKLWQSSRSQLMRQQLLQTPSAWLAMRVPGADGFWFGKATAERPQWMVGAGNGESALADHLFRSRTDVCAIAAGCGRFGHHLFSLEGQMPGVFDEQVRHLGKMPWIGPNDVQHLDTGGNVHWLAGQPLLLGTTANRLVLNAELFEQCAKAYVLASATGQTIQPLPWLARFIANRRLHNDQRAAAFQVMNGQLPKESYRY